MKSIEILEEEHQFILNVLNVFEYVLLNSMTDASWNFVSEFIHFCRKFVDHIHHQKEEVCLFDFLNTKGFSNDEGPLGTMLLEHEVGRKLVGFIEEAHARRNKIILNQFGLEYVHLLRNHIHKENHCLYPMCESVLTESDDLLILSGYQYEQDSFFKAMQLEYAWLDEHMAKMGINLAEENDVVLNQR